MTAGVRLADVSSGAGPDTAFWSARPELERIGAFAHARMCSRWAVLGVVLARVVCTVPPNVVLPPTVGSDASLNLFVSVVGKSGSGKSAAIEAAKAAVATEGFPTVPLGSGEGISRSFAYRRHKDNELVWVERAVLFTATEVDSLAALAGRQGATLGSQMREMFNGGELGFGYAAADKRIILPDHSYRASVIVGVQPGRAGTLLDDEDGGTPQRFLWLPGTDSTIPRHPPPAPGRLVPPPLTWPMPSMFLAGLDEGRAEGEALGGREELSVDPVAVDAIQTAAYMRATGIGAPLDGHALLVRLKTAAALGVLAGRKMVTADDWALAGMIMSVSDRTRTQMQTELAEARAVVSERLGRAEGIRQSTAQQIQAVRDEQRVTGLILKKMANPPKLGTNWRRSTLRKTFPYRDRETFDQVFESLLGGSDEETLAHALADGDIHLQQGDKGTHLSTSPRASQERA